MTFDDFLSSVPSGDLIVLNDTKVLRRRVFAGDLEILFLKGNESGKTWEVLFPSKGLELGHRVELPEGPVMTLTRKGRPQQVEVDHPLDEAYFERVGELPLPPYIQKARDERHMRKRDERWYQTEWAEKPGSFAAPTASLHFGATDLAGLQVGGARFARVTLHVGLGTFLPVTAEDLKDHEMHSEWVHVPPETCKRIQDVKARGGRVWAIGTTVARALESLSSAKLGDDGRGGFVGFTNLLIKPGYEWKVVDRLVTNFHQPKSTLFALVASFAGFERAKESYAWAIERRFRLFSYGDLSVWIR